MYPARSARPVLRAILDSRERMNDELWANIPPALLAEIEADMYRHAREQLLVYWAESAGREVPSSEF